MYGALETGRSLGFCREGAGRSGWIQGLFWRQSRWHLLVALSMGSRRDEFGLVTACLCMYTWKASAIFGTWGDSNAGGSWQEMGHRNQDLLWSHCCSFLACLSKGGLGTFLSHRPTGCPCGL